MTKTAHKRYEMKPGVYKLKKTFKDLSRDTQEDLWIMIKTLIDSNQIWNHEMGVAYLKKYYHSPGYEDVVSL